MKPYELTYIISSEISGELAESTAKEIETFIQGKEGVIIKSEKITPKTLSYNIKKQSSGFFGVVEFQLEPEHVEELKTKLEKDDKIIRHMLVIKNPPKIQKERRTKRKIAETPETGAVKEEIVATESVEKEEKTTKKVELEDIEKKLDEILSE